MIKSISFLFKSNSYSYEKEIRILYQFDEVSNEFRHCEKDGMILTYVTPDIVFPIKEVILGPKFENAFIQIPFLQEQLDKMANTIHTRPIKISLSGLLS